MSKELQEIIELIKTKELYSTRDYDWKDNILALLRQLAEADVCPECKGLSSVGVNTTNYLPTHVCPACRGLGTYRAWAEGQIEQLRVEVERLTKENNEHKFTLKLANKEYDEFQHQLSAAQQREEKLKGAIKVAIVTLPPAYHSNIQALKAAIEQVKVEENIAKTKEDELSNNLRKAIWLAENRIYDTGGSIYTIDGVNRKGLLDALWAALAPKSEEKRSCEGCCGDLDPYSEPCQSCNVATHSNFHPPQADEGKGK
jgi:hypothetical protein